MVIFSCETIKEVRKMINGDLLKDKLLMGLNVNPIPLEFSQSLTTAECLSHLHSLIQKVIDTNENVSEEILQKVAAELSELEKKLHSEVTPENIIKNYGDYVTNYLVNRLSDLISESLNLITFGIEDGFFTAYIPDNMESIAMSTCLDDTDDFGKLMLTY